MIWLVEVLVKSYTCRTNLENVSRAHPIISYTRDGADMHLFPCDLTARTHRALELKELSQLHQKWKSTQGADTTPAKVEALAGFNETSGLRLHPSTA